MQIKELKSAALLIKQFAEKVKNENQALIKKLEEEASKPNIVELESFEGISDEELARLEALHSRQLVAVAKERGRRQAVKEFEDAKSQVLEMTKNIQAVSQQLQGMAPA